MFRRKLDTVERNIMVQKNGRFFLYTIFIKKTLKNNLYEINRSVQEMDKYEVSQYITGKSQIEFHQKYGSIDASFMLHDESCLTDTVAGRERLLVEFSESPEKLKDSRNFDECLLLLLQKDRIRNRIYKTQDDDITNAYLYYRAGMMNCSFMIPVIPLYVGKLSKEDGIVRREYDDETAKKMSRDILYSIRDKISFAPGKKSEYTHFGTIPYLKLIESAKRQIEHERKLYCQKLERYGGDIFSMQEISTRMSDSNDSPYR